MVYVAKEVESLESRNNNKYERTKEPGLATEEGASYLSYLLQRLDFLPGKKRQATRLLQDVGEKERKKGENTLKSGHSNIKSFLFPSNTFVSYLSLPLAFFFYGESVR